jgi:RsiW-degrading membrane proteinase PrsW (M82 family)
MIFTIGAILALLGYFWYRQTEYAKDWRDVAVFLMITIGLALMSTSVLILAWRYLP